MLECPHLHLWLALARWGRMSCCISCDVQKWECTTAFTELHVLHWSQHETISAQQGYAFSQKTYTNAKAHENGARRLWEHVNNTIRSTVMPTMRCLILFTCTLLRLPVACFCCLFKTYIFLCSSALVPFFASAIIMQDHNNNSSQRQFQRLGFMTLVCHS